MPIKPIDIISIPNRTQEASQVQHDLNQRAQQAHSQLNHIFNKDTKHNSQQTVKTTKTENNEYRYDAKEKGNGTYQGNPGSKKKKDDKSLDAGKPPMSNASKFDIKI